MTRLDGYLSNKIQQIYQRAKVLVSDHGDFVLQRDNEPDLELGKSFKEARASIFAMLRADKPLLHQNHLRAYNILAEIVLHSMSLAPDRNKNIAQALEKAKELIDLEETRRAKIKREIRLRKEKQNDK